MSLKVKLEKLKASQTGNQIDWQQRKKEWIQKVNDVLNQTKSWFSAYAQDGLIKPIETQKTISEEFLGDYQATQLEYEFGTNRLVFEPMGRNIVGGKGRIDVYLRGRKIDKYILVLLETTGGEEKWFLSPFEDKSRRTEFTKESLEQLVEGWIENISI